MTAPKPKMPSSIKVGPLTYSLALTDDLDDDTGGVTRHDTLEVVLNERLGNEASTKLTAVHELLHLAWTFVTTTIDWRDHLARTSGDSPEELVVELLDDRVFALLRDNPELVAWIVSPDQLTDSTAPPTPR